MAKFLADEQGLNEAKMLQYNVGQRLTHKKNKYRDLERRLEKLLAITDTMLVSLFSVAVLVCLPAIIYGSSRNAAAGADVECRSVPFWIKAHAEHESRISENPFVQILVERLGLKPHPEGGFFSENWRSERSVTVSEPDFRAVRSAGSNIYYLLEEGDFSAWHWLKEEQIYYWHAGGKAKVHTIDNSGTLTTISLCDVLQDADCVYETIMPHSTWIAIEAIQGSGFVLIGDAAFPGFDFKDWKLGRATDLIRDFPAHSDIIKRLTRQQ
ncbi:uncharacterized protein [Haliotis asinina]|uniref:uncharacterized protein n=1 Tax=Haliotis asinina TaxID=109174 RepID=UPI003532133A